MKPVLPHRTVSRYLLVAELIEEGGRGEELVEKYLRSLRQLVCQVNYDVGALSEALVLHPGVFAVVRLKPHPHAFRRCQDPDLIAVTDRLVGDELFGRIISVIRNH